MKLTHGMYVAYWCGMLLIVSDEIAIWNGWVEARSLTHIGGVLVLMCGGWLMRGWYDEKKRLPSLATSNREAQRES